jgi:hypothetical protein
MKGEYPLMERLVKISDLHPRTARIVSLATQAIIIAIVIFFVLVALGEMKGHFERSDERDCSSSVDCGYYPNL